MRVSIVGTGYVGLVSGVCLAEYGHDVVCVDVLADRVDMINAGRAPIHEEGLPELLTRHAGHRLRATTDLQAAVHESDVTLIAVGTPYRGDRIDLQYIEGASRQIGDALRDKDAYHVVAVKSTVVPGTIEDVVLPLLEEASGRRAGPDFGVGMNPEFLREGSAVRDFLEPDRIVLGGIDERTRAVLRELYAGFDAEKVETTPATAAMIKYAANSLLATLISFSNEIANLCVAQGGIDVVEVMQGVHLDHRLNPTVDGRRVAPSFLTYLEAGCGFGGSCFPKDVKALVAHGADRGYTPAILHQVVQVNEGQPLRMVELLNRRIPDLSGRTVAVLGAAFKPGTDDIRESPALTIVRALLEQGARVVLHDPIAIDNARTELGEGPEYQTALDQALDGVDAVLLVTSWPEYEALPELLGSRPDVVVVDGRRRLAVDAVPNYEGIGRS